MAFIDDWGGTSASDRKQLQERCEWMGCGHMRYLHGEARTVRAQVRYVTYEAGKCVRCKCMAFQGEGAILPDEILDAHVALGDETKEVHLADYGIAVLCPQVITRWLDGGNTIEVPCALWTGATTRRGA